MAGDQKHYHYVPATYLAGFTASGSRNDYLFVRDVREGRGWKAPPNKLAKIRDYYALEDIEGIDRNALEHGLAELEWKVSPIIRELSRSPRLPTDEELAQVLAFVAIQALRIPAWLESVEDFERRVTDSLMQAAVASKERFEAMRRAAEREGVEGASEWSYDEIRRGLEPGRLELVIPRELVLARGFGPAEDVAQLLSERRWTVIYVKNARSDSSFITSDRPVVLIPTRPDAPQHLGFGLRCSEVVFPLSRNVCLVGAWEAGPHLFQVTPEIAGHVNWYVAQAAHRYLFTGWSQYRETTYRASTKAEEGCSNAADDVYEAQDSSRPPLPID